MAARDRRHWGKLGAVLLTTTALTANPAVVTSAYSQTASAQNTGTELVSAKIPEGSKLLLSANELIYDRDNDRVIVRGAVQIYYGGYKMVARQVEYNQKNGRLIATGGIELVEPGGNRVYADKMDITDDFADGFVNTLRVETTDNTRLAAETAERVNGKVSILHKGIYTACLPCESDPSRPPVWQIKAERVIQNGETHTIRLEKAKFELFGRPIAFFPSIEVPDNTVKRKSGFLFPTMSTSQNLGFGIKVPYYWAIAPDRDMTVNATGYTNQGFLLDAEYRQRFENGTHVFRFAGIDQMNPGSFSADTTDSERNMRGMVASKGEFKINPRWTFGWDAMLQSDNNFAKTYGLDDLDSTVHTNKVYLKGFGQRNSFEANAYYFDVQDADTDSIDEKKQAIVGPVIDYKYYAPEAVAGGELSLDANYTHLTRSSSDFYTVSGRDRFRGLSGDYNRLSAEVQWQRTFTTPQGILLTPIAAARGDALNVDMSDPSDLGTYDGDWQGNGAKTRGMVTAGLEARYPILMTTQNSSHVFEPIAQIFVRPDEQMVGGLPNEDAQSFVFDATNLFERDKFSGYDRIEGGTRANVGFRYTGTFDAGYSIRSIFGQSYQLAGKNSFASEDLVGAGLESGLESTVSDFVGMVAVDLPVGVSLSTSYRLDEKTLDLRRADASVSYRSDRWQTDVTYTHITAQPDYGFDRDQEELQTAGSLNLNDRWSVFGSLTWDINNNVLSRRGVGVTYADECTEFSLVYYDKRDTDNESAVDWSIGARVVFRTLGDVSLGSTKLTGFD
ncbi:LPS-assembly protein LptD [Rhizobium sp. PAMB 3174]